MNIFDTQEVCVTWHYVVFCSSVYGVSPVCGSQVHKMYMGRTPSVNVLSLKDFVTVRAVDSGHPHDSGENYGPA